MNIVIVGYRCTGKSSVGKILADTLAWDFVDTDCLISLREKADIHEIISAKGWKYFRYQERNVVHELSEKDKLVIATGGGVVNYDSNVNSLKKNGFVVWLKADSDIIRSRMENDIQTSSMRPSLTGGNLFDEIQEMLKKRTPYYKKAADIEVDTGAMSPFEITNHIIGEYSARYPDLR
ncbi:MAG: shikimate kinase [Deltaproteobacteria bacterium]|nr:shikimate kinase [Deltaproteobacteria bacterium]